LIIIPIDFAVELLFGFRKERKHKFVLRVLFLQKKVVFKISDILKIDFDYLKKLF